MKRRAFIAALISASASVFGIRKASPTVTSGPFVRPTDPWSELAQKILWIEPLDAAPGMRVGTLENSVSPGCVGIVAFADGLKIPVLRTMPGPDVPSGSKAMVEYCPSADRWFLVAYTEAQSA